MIQNSAQAASKLKEHGIVAILRGNYSLDDFYNIAEALASASIYCTEVTLNSGDALTAITRLRQRFENEMIIGAGTVRTAEQAKQAIDAGAEFLISPNFDAASAALAQARGVLHMPGVATPTEAQNAFAAGCKMLKLFPVDVLGGPAYLKAIRAPLDDIEFVVTGGINIDNIADYVKAGAVGVGVGSSLVPAKNWSKSDIAINARKMRVAWDSAKQG